MNTTQSDTDDELSPGELQLLQIDLEDAIATIDVASSRMGIDRRTSMPTNRLSNEYKIRTARKLIKSIQMSIETARREL